MRKELVYFSCLVGTLIGAGSVAHDSGVRDGIIDEIKAVTGAEDGIARGMGRPGNQEIVEAISLAGPKAQVLVLGNPPLCSPEAEARSRILYLACETQRSAESTQPQFQNILKSSGLEERRSSLTAQLDQLNRITIAKGVAIITILTGLFGFSIRESRRASQKV